MKNLLIFAGTTEGRILIEQLVKITDISIYACTATEYGKVLLPSSDNLTISSKRLDEDDIFKLMISRHFDAVIDATHPYAVNVSYNIKSAADKAALRYIRLIRPEEHSDSNNIINVSSTDEAIEYLKNTSGNILVTTGSNELTSFCSLNDYKERIYARILPNPDMVKKCYDAGFTGKHLICMQGPFTEEMNTALIHQYNIRYTVTKNSGKQGGFIEKVRSAVATDTQLIVIARPVAEQGFSLKNVLSMFI